MVFFMTVFDESLSNALAILDLSKFVLSACT
jgi:hypothetical protein